MRLMLTAVSFIAWFAAAVLVLFGISYAFGLNGAVMGHAAWTVIALCVWYVLWTIGKMQDAAIYRWSQQMQILGAIHEELESIKDASETAAREARMIAERKRRAQNQERLTG